MNTSAAGNSPNPPTDDGYYYGTTGVSDNRFPLGAWEEAQKDLLQVEPVLRALAQQHDLKILGNLEGKWLAPSRGVALSRGSVRFEYRISLNPNFLVDGRPIYVLEGTRFPSLSWLPGRKPTYEKFAEYETKDLENAELIRADVRAAIESKRPP